MSVTRRTLFGVPIHAESKPEYDDYMRGKTGKGLGSSEGVRPWKYNRIVGWIEFYAQGWMIKTELWCAREQRITKRTKKVTMDYKYKLDDVVDTLRLDNEEIRAAILDYLARLAEGRRACDCLKGRYLDHEQWAGLLPYLDLKRMVADLVKPGRTQAACGGKEPGSPLGPGEPVRGGGQALDERLGEDLVKP